MIPYLSQISGLDDKITKKAIEEGNVEYLNTDYVTDQDISIKADYLIHEKGNIYIVLEYKTEKQVDKLLVDEMIILDENNNINYSTNNTLGEGSLIIYYKDELIIVRFEKTDFDLRRNNLQINKIEIENNNNYNIIDGKWLISIN